MKVFWEEILTLGSQFFEVASQDGDAIFCQVILMVFWTILFVYLATKASYQGTIFEMENTISYQEMGNVC